MRSTKIIKICSSSLCTCLHHMVILRTRNKITDFLMIFAWASPFNVSYGIFTLTNPLCHCHVTNFSYHPLTPRRSMLSQYSFSVFTVEFLVIIVLCPTMSQLKVVATITNFMEKEKNSFIKKYIYSLVVKTL